MYQSSEYSLRLGFLFFLLCLHLHYIILTETNQERVSNHNDVTNEWTNTIRYNYIFSATSPSLKLNISFFMTHILIKMLCTFVNDNNSILFGFVIHLITAASKFLVLWIPCHPIRTSKRTGYDFLLRNICLIKFEISNTRKPKVIEEQYIFST